MNKDFVCLLKLRFISLFKINELVNEKDKNRKNRKLAFLISLIILLFVICGYSAGYAYFLTTMDCGKYIPLFMMVFCSLSILVFTLFRANDEIFQFKDYGTLMSLPIKTSIIVMSRISYLYFFALLITIVFMIPSGIIYFIFEQFTIVSFIIWLLGIICIPILPIMVAVIWTYVIVWISSKTQNSKGTSFFLYLISILAIIATSFFNSSSTDITIDFSNHESIRLLFINVIESMKKNYPISELYSKAILDQSVVSFVLLAALSILVLVLFVAVVTPKYKKICSSLKTYNSKSGYNVKNLSESSILMALYKIELKRYFTTGVYFANTIMGVFFVLILSISLFFVDLDSMVERVKQLQTFQEAGVFFNVIPFLVAAFLSFSCTSCVSISLEGKYVWIKKSLPISIEKIIQGKILVNLTLTIPTSIVSSILLSIALGYDFIQWVIVLLLFIVFSLFSAVLGILINFKFLNYDWETETQVVKQGMASMIGMLSGAVIAMACAVPMFFLNQMSGSLYFLLIASVIMVITFSIYNNVKKKSL